MIKGRSAEALQTLARLHAGGDVDDPIVQGEFAAITTQLDQEASVDQAWSVIFKDWVNIRKVMFGIILQFATQMTGVSAIQYYAA